MDQVARAAAWSRARPLPPLRRRRQPGRGTGPEHRWTHARPCVEVPPVPGVYTVEVWLEDARAKSWRRAPAPLRFDDTAACRRRCRKRPPAGSPATDPAVLEIGHPGGPLPLSGIRGYAISLDRGDGSSPCAHPSRAASPETDLPTGGIGDDTVVAGDPARGGQTYARVVAVSGSGVASPVATARLQSRRDPAPAVSLRGAGGLEQRRRCGSPRTPTMPSPGWRRPGRPGPSRRSPSTAAPPITAAGETARGLGRRQRRPTVAYFARDAAGNVATAARRPRRRRRPRRCGSTKTRRGCAFAAAQDPAEPERIEALVGDPLSGPSPERGSIGVRLAGTRARFEALPTRVDGDRLVARWDSDSYPAGKYEFLATGYDRRRQRRRRDRSRPRRPDGPRQPAEDAGQLEVGSARRAKLLRVHGIVRAGACGTSRGRPLGGQRWR